MMVTSVIEKLEVIILIKKVYFSVSVFYVVITEVTDTVPGQCVLNS